jgi:adenine phosphoribosyltransferase
VPNKLTTSDLIATGGSAAAAGTLIEKAGGKTLEYMFIISLPFLKGEEKLNAPTYALIQAED